MKFRIQRSIFFSISCFVLIISCTSSEKEPSGFVYSDIHGLWYLSKIVSSEGTVEPYIHNCSERDYIEVEAINQILYHHHSPDCSSEYLESCTDYYILQDPPQIQSCNNTFDGEVTVNPTTLRIDYNEIRNFGYPENNLTNITGIIFSRE
jgi:hypothetical protein